MSVLPSSAIPEVAAKFQAKKLSQFLALNGVSLNHSKCLEAVASMHGHKSWQHMSASFSKPEPTTGTLLDSIEAILKRKVESQRPILSNLLADLVPQFRDSVTFEYRFVNETDGGRASNKYVLSFDAVCQNDHDTVISVGLDVSVVISSFESITIDPCFSFKIDREGYGPESLGGHREDSIDFLEVVPVWTDSNIELDVTNLSSFEATLNRIFSEFKYQEALVEAVSPNTLEETRVDFSKSRIPGFSKEELIFGEPED